MHAPDLPESCRHGLEVGAPPAGRVAALAPREDGALVITPAELFCRDTSAREHVTSSP